MRKYEAIRTEIKTLSESQIGWKARRKQGDEGNGFLTDHPGHMVQKNKYELRHLFQAYAILKGIQRPEVKKPSNYNGLILDEKKIEQMINKYKPTEEVV